MKTRRFKHRHSNMEHMEWFQMHQSEFEKYKKWFRWMPAVLILIIVVIGIFLYRWVGQENFQFILSGFFGLLIIGVVLQALFFRNLTAKLINPLMELKEGVESITRGDYSRRLSTESIKRMSESDMKGLMNSFNNMAAQLEVADRLKREYEENRKMLIASISHDLKTPMTTIKGYLEVLSEGIVHDPEILKKYLRVMENNTDYMNRLIDDLFLYSKLDIDQVKFDYQTFEAKPFFEDMMEEFKIMFTDQNMMFEYSNDIPNDVMFLADNGLLHRAIRNIIDNAVKYAINDDSVHVKVKLSADTDYAETAKYLIIRIQDYGVGIPEEKLPFIFERFYRIDAERTKHLASTGLGLAITKELILAHDGQIVAGNHNDGGAIFVMHLPLKVNALGGRSF